MHPCTFCSLDSIDSILKYQTLLHRRSANFLPSRKEQIRRRFAIFDIWIISTSYIIKHIEKLLIIEGFDVEIITARTCCHLSLYIKLMLSCECSCQNTYCYWNIVRFQMLHKSLIWMLSSVI